MHLSEAFAMVDRELIAVGHDGGRLSPAIYDTAMALRTQDSPTVHGSAWAWLLAMQQPDGGWGTPETGRARTLPTLSAVLALHRHAPTPGITKAINAGLAFIAEQAPLWAETLPDDLPVGNELVLPPLLAEAAAQGLVIDPTPFAQLIQLGAQRRQLIAHFPIMAGSPAVHSFEAWGALADPTLLDGSGGVGHSPAATLHWLSLARRNGLPEQVVAPAKAYLAAAGASTGWAGTGLLPTVWPITRFEQIWVLYGIVTLGLLKYPAIKAQIMPQLEGLAAALNTTPGLGMSDHFMADGDDTVTAVATLRAAGFTISSEPIERFRNGDHFVSYHHEIQPSLTTTAHALHALALAGEPFEALLATLLNLQRPDGRWEGDKWHSSWLYATSQALVALAAARCVRGVGAGCTAIVRAQHTDGSWESVSATAYALMALVVAQRAGVVCPGRTQAIRAGAAWLAEHDLDSSERYTPSWIGKEAYTPYRIDRAWAAAVLIAAAETYDNQ